MKKRFCDVCEEEIRTPDLWLTVGVTLYRDQRVSASNNRDVLGNASADVCLPCAKNLPPVFSGLAEGWE